MKSNQNTPSDDIPIRFLERSLCLNLVLKSGIFKTRSAEGNEIPTGVYEFYGGKKLSKERTIPDVKVTTLISKLMRIISLYHRPLKDHKEEIANEILDDFEKDLSRYGFTKEETQEIARKYKIKRKIINSDAFEHKKADKKYYDLYLPLFQVFQAHLNIKQEDTFHYMAYFLVGCELEEPTVNQAYERIRRFIKRHEGPSIDMKTHRRDPSRIILTPTIPPINKTS